MKKLKSALMLFLTMFKIGLFTFGGGYAMIAVIERELVERKKWIEHEEYMDVIAIAESTPGPLAINSATYIGYKVCGVLGSVFATLGVVLPSFIIIFIISLFFDAFLTLEYVQYAFYGIQACVAFLILSAGIKMFKHLKRTALNVILFTLTVTALLTLSLFAKEFSSIFYILIGGVVGLTVYLASYFKSKKEKQNNVKEQSEKGDKN
ncbi:MAG: chromate transporter [Clostridia bacterium]|nr:chromate transporter [Clostridia bacterium]